MYESVPTVHFLSVKIVHFVRLIIIMTNVYECFNASSDGIEHVLSVCNMHIYYLYYSLNKGTLYENINKKNSSVFPYMKQMFLTLLKETETLMFVRF